MDTEYATVEMELKQQLAARQEAAPAAPAVKTYDFASGAVERAAPTAAAEAESQEAAEEVATEVVAKAKAAPVKAEPAPSDDYDRRMAKVMAAAQKVQAERQAAKQESVQMKADMEELARYRELKARAKEDPVGWAELAEIKPDEYATMLMDKGSFSPERKKILEQQKQLNELQSWKQEQETQRRQQEENYVRNQVVNEVEAEIAKHGDRFDLVQRTKSHAAVIDEIVKHYNSTIDPDLGIGETLPYEEALERVEAKLVAFYSPLLESPKLRKSGQQPSAPASGQQASRKPQATITNKMTGGRTTPQKELSEQDRLKLAAEHLFGQMLARR